MKGQIEALCGLAWCYYQGDGVKRNKEKGTELFKEYIVKTKQENGDAITNLGRYYHIGAIEKDPKKAVECYEKSAKYSHVRAFNSLGFCYQNGFGVEKDLAKAVKYYTY